MINDIIQDAEIRMNKCVEKFKKTISKIRGNYASASILDEILINYYDKLIPLNQLTNIIVENQTSLKINLFDTSLLQIIEKAIISSNLGLNPIINGNQIRVILPTLTEDRRKELVKIVRHEAENSRISIRNIRRDSNDKVKHLLKDKKITDDKEHNAQENIQKLTKVYIKYIDDILIDKEKNLMKF